MDPSFDSSRRHSLVLLFLYFSFIPLTQLIVQHPSSQFRVSAPQGKDERGWVLRVSVGLWLNLLVSSGLTVPLAVYGLCFGFLTESDQVSVVESK